VAETTQRRAPRTRKPLGFFILPAVIVLVAVGASVPLRAMGDSQRFRLAQVRVAASSTDVVVQTVIEGAAREGTPYKVWFTLTPEGGTDAVYRSKRVDGVITNSAPVPISIREPVAVNPGRYRVDVWLHQRTRSVFVHADVRHATVDLRQSDATAIRPEPVGATQVLPTVRTDAGFPARMQGTVVVTTRATTDLPVSLDIGLERVSDEPTDLTSVWWVTSLPLLFSGPSTVSTTVDEFAAVPPGRYRPVFQARSKRAVLDQVSLPETIVVPMPSATVHRETMPVEDLMVLSVDTPTDLVDGEQHGLSAVLMNLADQPRTAQISAAIAPVGSIKPWARTKATCNAPELTLAPHQVQRVSLACVSGSPPGKAEVSFWVHRVKGTKQVHSDGVLAATSVDITANDTVRHRLTRPTGHALLTVVAGPEKTRKGETLEAQAAVTNLTDAPLTIDIWWLLSRAASGKPADEGDHRTVTLAPHEIRGLTLRGKVLARPGTYQLSVAVHTRVHDDDPWAHGDQGWATNTIEVEAP